LHRIQLIHSNPYEFVSGQTRDENGRPVEIHFFGRYDIHYWIDEADKDLKITKIERRKGLSRRG
jgi:hypothetical protein